MVGSREKALDWYLEGARQFVARASRPEEPRYLPGRAKRLLALPVGAGLMLFHIAVHVIRKSTVHILDVREQPK